MGKFLKDSFSHLLIVKLLPTGVASLALLNFVVQAQDHDNPAGGAVAACGIVLLGVVVILAMNFGKWKSDWRGYVLSKEIRATDNRGPGWPVYEVTLRDIGTKRVPDTRGRLWEQIRNRGEIWSEVVYGVD